MSLSYDQYSFVRMIFEEAYIPAMFRRRAERISQDVDIELREWDGEANPADAPPFAVQIVDYSATGFGIHHSRAIEVGEQFTLNLPRPNEAPMALVLSAVRCNQLGEEQYEIGLAYDSVLDAKGTVVWGAALHGAKKRRHRNGKPRLSLMMKLLFILFGLMGILIGALI
jgi:hypothetical protein